MNMIQKQIVLTEDERASLLEVLASGKPKEILAANILIMSDKRYPPMKIASLLSTTKQTVNNVKRRFLDGGLLGLRRKNIGKAPYPAKITGEVEAHIIRIACSKAPEGRNRWTLEMIADKIVELKILDEISYISVRSVLKKRNLSLT